MQTNTLEQSLFLRGWISPAGLLGKNSVFDQPKRPESLHALKRAYFPLSSILHGGDVDCRVLVTSEFGRGAENNGPQSVEIQQRSKQTGDWVTQTIHTPAQFIFKLSADKSYLLPSEGPCVDAFMRFAQENGFTRCLADETSLGQVALQSTEPEHKGAYLKMSLDPQGTRAMVVDVKASPDMIIGAGPIALTEFTASPDAASAKILNRIERAREYRAENGGLIKRLTSFFGPK